MKLIGIPIVFLEICMHCRCLVNCLPLGSLYLVVSVLHNLQVASKLAAIANGGTVSQRKAQFQKLEITCVTCHERFRSEYELSW